MDGQIGNYAFGSTAGHPFLKAIIDTCVRCQQDPSWVTPMMQDFPLTSKAEFFVLNTTVPRLISRTLAEGPTLAATVSILFPDDACDLENWTCSGDLGTHLMDGT